MVKLLKSILLKREAVLFDTPLFIVKGFVAVMLGYVLFSSNSLIGRDMISVLLGLMLTLEPVNVTGLKSGWEQFSASIIGGGVTALIVLAGGINLVTVPLAVAATLYITLRINWRRMSVIAVFTSIYMTQYIQLTSGGDPSMYLTLRLRLLALGSGILIAVAMNFLFSLIFYRSMLRKRTIFTIEKLVSSIDSLIRILTEGKESGFDALEKQIIALFSDIDYIIGGMMDMKRKKTKDGHTSSFILKLKELRNINHYILDIVMMAEEETPEVSILSELMQVRNLLESLDDYIGHKSEKGWFPSGYTGDSKNISRIYKSMEKISEFLKN
jgi:hypothetical protein